MSYCRFSCDNFRSDVYVYESCMGGFVTHVAGNKKMFQPIPDYPLHLVPNFGATWSQAERKMIYPSRLREIAADAVFWLWAKWHRVSMWSLRIIPSRPIGLPYDGEQFTDSSIEECIERLLGLRMIGYHVPEHALTKLRAEEAGESE